MGVKISLPPPGAGGPAGPDEGRLPGSSRWPVTRGRHICRPYGLTVYSRPIMSHPVGAGLCSARGSYPGNGVRGKRAGRACPAPTEQQKFARTYPTTNKKWALPLGGAPIHSTTNQSCRMASSALIFTALLAGRIPATRPTSVANTSAASISHGGIIEMVLPPPPSII